MANRFYISDTHFGHANIIKYSDRPFSNTLEMDEFMIDMWNQYVKPQDHVSHLGDVTMARGGRVQQDQFKRLIGRLNGHKRLFLGNHDHFPIQTYLDAGFEKIYATWRSDGGILWSHIPVHPQSLGSARANVHGHTHTQPDYKPALNMNQDGKVRVVPYINISVEKTDYHPISLEEVQERIRKVKEGLGDV